MLKINSLTLYYDNQYRFQVLEQNDVFTKAVQATLTQEQLLALLAEAMKEN